MRYCLYFVAAIWGASFNTTFGDIVISVDMDTSVPGIQDNRTVAIDESFDVDIVIELMGTASLSSYTISTRFDAAELDVDALASSDPTPPGFLLGNDAILAGADTDSGETDVDLIDASAFTGPTAPATFVVATLSFIARAPTNGLADIDILPGTFGKPQNGLFDNSNDDILSTAITFNGGSVIAIPEPSSLLYVSVLAMLAAGLVVRRPDALRPMATAIGMIFVENDPHGSGTAAVARRGPCS